MLQTRRLIEDSFSRELFPSSVYGEGCVLYLPFWQEDMQGSTLLSYDQNHLSASVFGALWGSQGRTFDGDDYITVPYGTWITGATRISVIAWASRSVDMAADLRMLVNREQGGGFSLGYYGTSDNRLKFYINTGTWSSIVWSTALALNTPTCLAGVYDGANINAYLNGVSDAAPVAKTGDMGGGTQNVKIGAKSDDNTGGWKGLIGEVWIIRGIALTPSEILQIYLATMWRYQ